MWQDADAATAYESIVLFLSVLIVNQTLSDGRSK